MLAPVQKSYPDATSDPTEALKNSLEPINAQLYAVEERIRGQARAFDPAVEGYVGYAIESSGKRLRPALALLAAGATGNIGPSHLDLAVVVELIHAATLIHDDILDGADKRRGQPSANAKWGNAISVLLGDCLFAHALKLSSSFQNGEIGRRIAQAASEVCSGEIIQTQRRFDLKLSVPDYYKIIEMKTGALFAERSRARSHQRHAQIRPPPRHRLPGLRRRPRSRRRRAHRRQNARQRSPQRQAHPAHPAPPPDQRRRRARPLPRDHPLRRRR